ncbi:ABC transporter substrate-binding protein [Xylanibacillus composti]|uniref:ABC transporter substrate-binding protein n=1 Tax=Xylanibacillus composti TaxID=1572762 RepID=A0A8J4M146_9BACL|nr:iron-hydroxamate ABC transporter substrate-binding protein [Xylanibacillus composti]MDT9724899.1 ABC transporter substrate-binding protein [Xylanibacillus composti]GIQ68134.1 ABC transporter substrate-binding protein [Xylanibacillus composti]
MKPKQIWMPFILLLLLVISACGSNTAAPPVDTGAQHSNNEQSSDSNAAGENSPDTIIYESERGPIQVPADPQRVIVLASFTGNVMQLGVNLVGVDSWSKTNPHFEEALKDVEEVSEESLEKIIELEPDLIIGFSTMNNIEKLNEIAPTVTFTYNQVDYLTQHIEIGKLLNKEAEAQAWVDQFRERARQSGDEIRAKIGEESTVTVIENFDKQIYVFGDNWGRGTEILYQEMRVQMPEKVKEMALEAGYYALSLEVLPEFAGDYLVFSKHPETDNSFMETDTYRNIPAVKNNRVFEVDSRSFYFNDALTLEHQLAFFRKSFLGED